MSSEIAPIEVPGLAGRVALVTGAGRGIGECIASQLAHQGVRVVATDVDAPAAPNGGLARAMDVRDAQATEAVCDEMLERFGRVDILVLNAGVLRTGSLRDLEPRTWDEIMDVNLTGAYRCARRLVPAMADTGWGRVLGIGSSAGRTGGAVAAAGYASSKGGLMMFVRSIAVEFAGRGVTANSIAPSFIATDMLEGHEDASRVPVGRLGTPNDVASAAVFLCSPHAGYITGEILNVGGGFLMS